MPESLTHWHTGECRRATPYEDLILSLRDPEDDTPLYEIHHGNEVAALDEAGQWWIGCADMHPAEHYGFTFPDTVPFVDAERLIKL